MTTRTLTFADFAWVEVVHTAGDKLRLQNTGEPLLLLWDSPTQPEKTEPHGAIRLESLQTYSWRRKATGGKIWVRPLRSPGHCCFSITPYA